MSTQFVSHKNRVVSVGLAVVALVALAKAPQAVFDKALGLAIIIPAFCLFTFISGLLMGRVGIVIATALTLALAIAVVIG